MARFSGNRGGILKVLLIILGVFFLCIVIGGIYVLMNVKEWTADLGSQAAQSVIKQSSLPEDQKAAILSEIDQLTTDYKNGKVSTEKVGRVIQTMTEGTLIPVAIVQASNAKYVQPSDMTDKEKAEAALILQRLARGLYEKKIPKQAIDEITRPIGDVDSARHSWMMKENPTRMEIDQYIANAKASADAAMIPNEPFTVNIADEFKKVVHGE